jgi:hypothetical protein
VYRINVDVIVHGGPALVSLEATPPAGSVCATDRVRLAICMNPETAAVGYLRERFY